MNFAELAIEASATGNGDELSGDAIKRFGALVERECRKQSSPVNMDGQKFYPVQKNPRPYGRP